MKDERGSLVGYIPSLLDELGRDLGFSYSLDYVPDGNYGYRRADNSWDGMIGLLTQDKADVGAAPLYKTHDRSRVVDFTVPYLTVHGTLITKTDTTVSPHVSLEAFLRRTPTQVGTLNRGVIVHSFRSTEDPFLRQLWQDMIAESTLTLTRTNKEGLERVRTQNYSFILPHTIGEYLATREPCDLMTVDRFLMDRGYSLVIRKNLTSLSVREFDRSLRRLEKRGKLRELYNRWWFDSSACRGVSNPIRHRKSDVAAHASSQNEADRLAQNPSFLYVLVLLFFNLLFL
ncbi:hypothetical protein CAPTEDRAFT_90091 [Capitella teleta]|uniref:Ionotropic glutamate receptor L-glutamate and glycine-binding domain-containing protein n=1 Tax=Capitella teleta TaxID=283909 RepID=R7VK58_CAPTE|nr:hypothetical protein CAPTEDRAFT_90091 [Capitella teleta]|eukprot:ELU16500.1 hypothetical protein CAPTEDRAFT_90091 [Capitella teleta]